jgi:hypothetical protein
LAAGITTVRQIAENAFDIRATSRLNRLYVELLKDNPEWGTAAPHIHRLAELLGLARHVDAPALRIIKLAVIAAAQHFWPQKLSSQRYLGVGPHGGGMTYQVSGRPWGNCSAHYKSR